MKEFFNNPKFKEEWKDIEGFEGYQVSNYGQVKSLNYRRTGKEQILKQTTNRDGYKVVFLKKKHCSVHRLVAQAFIPNPNKKCDVNHINGDKSDNTVFNLEWNTRQENVYHAFNNGLASNKNHEKKIICHQNNEIYNSLKEAGEISNIPSCGICNVLKGIQKTTHGYTFSYIN